MPSPNEIGYSQVQEWIDEDVFDEVEQISESSSDFNFRLGLPESGLNVHVVRYPGQECVEIVSQMPIPPEIMANLLELDYERNDLRIHLEHVLTSVPGHYEYLDQDENPVGFQDARIIRVRHRIYPDGGNKQVFMDSIMDMLNAMHFIRDAINTTVDNFDQNR